VLVTVETNLSSADKLRLRVEYATTPYSTDWWTAIKDLKTKTAQNTCDNSRIVVLITFFTSESQGILFYKRSLQQAPLLLYYQSSDILLAQWYPSSRSKVNRPVEQDGRGRQDGVSAFATKQKRLCLAHGDQARMRRIQGYRDKGKTMIQTTR
jgi:hypothetical protein